MSFIALLTRDKKPNPGRMQTINTLDSFTFENSNRGKFAFSIIVSVYNQELWIENSLESLFIQDIGFERAVELILVDDGSTDNSLELCLKIQARFPNNVKVVSQENSGLSAARNIGLSHATGILVNFMDPDDVLTPGTLSQVYSFFLNTEKEDLPFIAIPIYYSGARNGMHPKYRSMQKSNYIVDLVDEPMNFVLTAAATFYKKTIIEKYPFDSLMLGVEDSDVNLRIQRDTGGRFGYVCEGEAKYYYFQHVQGANQIAVTAQNPVAFWSSARVIRNLLQGVTNPPPSFFHEAIVYLLRPRIQAMNFEMFANRNEYDDLLREYRELLDLVPPAELAKSSWIENRNRHAALSQIGADPGRWELDAQGGVLDRGVNSFSINNLLVMVKVWNFGNQKLTVDVVFYNYGIEHLDLVLMNEQGESAQTLESSEQFSPAAAKYGMHFVSSANHRQFSIQYGRQPMRWQFMYQDMRTGALYKARRVTHPDSSVFSSKEALLKVSRQEHWARWANGELTIATHTKPRWMYILNSTFSLLLKKKKFLPERFFSRSEANAILLNDRPGYGDDNAEALFRYIQESGHSQKGNTWLVLDRRAPSFSELRKTKRVVQPRSLKHRILLLNARIIATSHLAHDFIYAHPRGITRLNRDLMNPTFFWLQHGVTVNDISRVSSRLSHALDGIVVAARHEEQFMRGADHYYSDEQVITSGFPRYDRLESNPQNTILVMPTWRTWLSGAMLPDGSHSPKNGFEESDFFNQWSALLGSPSILEVLQRSNSKLEFVLHPGMNAYKEEFNKFASEFISIKPAGAEPYRDIFARGDLLITDYSSVLFDFAYLKKPVIMFQFDQNEYRRKHYGEGIFDYEESAPGKVHHLLRDVEEAVVKYSESGFKLSAHDELRLETLFLHSDKSNSERAIAQILEIDKSRREL